MPTLEGLASAKVVERKGVSPMSPKEADRFLQVLPGWTFTNDSISKDYKFQSYLDGLDFACAVGKTAEEKNHHPDILIKWRHVKLTLSTHSIGGLSENDFTIAASAELLHRKSMNG